MTVEGDAPRDGTSKRPPRPAAAFAAGSITRREAMERLGVRDYAGLLVLLGDHGLAPPRPSDREIGEQAAVFEGIWNATRPQGSARPSGRAIA